MTDATGDKTVLVTGAAKRIGAAIVRSFAEDGWTVVLHYNHSEAEALSLAAELQKAGRRCVSLQADLGDEQQVTSLIPRCLDAVGHLDCLVNNAAHFVYDKLETMTWASWHSHLTPNLTAPLFLSRDFARNLPADRDGVIINMLDQKVFNLNPDFLSYTIGKAGLDALTTILAMSLAPRIRVCGIAPNVTLISGRQTPASFAHSQTVTPLGKSTGVEEIVAAVRFILQAPSMTGSVITIDGGESLTRRPRDVAFDPAARMK